MKIIEEAKCRKIELENELNLIDQLLALYSESVAYPKEIPELISQWGGLSGRASNALSCSGVKTLSQLLSISESELLKVPNFGRKTINEIKKFIVPHRFSSSTKARYDWKLGRFNFEDQSPIGSPH